MTPRRTAEPSENLFLAARDPRPLAARMRPRTLDEYVGQPHVTAPNAPLARDRTGETGSLILWVLPAPERRRSGTSSRVLPVVPSSLQCRERGRARLREIFELGTRIVALGECEAQQTVAAEFPQRPQVGQDTLLPAVEDGTVTLIGATTENPSFELNAALLSRARVIVLESLAPAEIETLLSRARDDRELGLGGMELSVDAEVFPRLAVETDGDARRALTVLEAAAVGVRGGSRSRCCRMPPALATA
jgi:putative ATPase